MYYHTVEFACCFGALYLLRMHSQYCKPPTSHPSDHMVRFNQLAKKVLLPLVSRELTTEGAENGIASLHEASIGNLAFRIELFRPLRAVEFISVDIELFCAHQA